MRPVKKFNIKVFLIKLSIYAFMILMAINLESCQVSKKRISVLNCAGTALMIDSREGYFNARTRYHFFQRHTPVKKTRH